MFQIMAHTRVGMSGKHVVVGGKLLCPGYGWILTWKCLTCAAPCRHDGKVSFGYSLMRGKRASMEDYFHAQVRLHIEDRCLRVSRMHAFPSPCLLGVDT